jgi:hypothetical protein
MLQIRIADGTERFFDRDPRHEGTIPRSSEIRKCGCQPALRRLVLCVKFMTLAVLGGLAEVGFLELPEIVDVEVAVGFEPVFVGLDG